MGHPSDPGLWAQWTRWVRQPWTHHFLIDNQAQSSSDFRNFHGFIVAHRVIHLCQTSVDFFWLSFDTINELIDVRQNGAMLRFTSSLPYLIWYSFKWIHNLYWTYTISEAIMKFRCDAKTSSSSVRGDAIRAMLDQYRTLVFQEAGTGQRLRSYSPSLVDVMSGTDTILR